MSTLFSVKEMIDSALGAPDSSSIGNMSVAPNISDLMIGSPPPTSPQTLVNKAKARAQIINFKLLHTILHLLAQQMRVLERKVELRDTGEPGEATDVIVSEIRLGAKEGKKTSTDTLLVVERRPSTMGIQRKDSATSKGRIAVVTIDQFANLEAKVHSLASKIGVEGAMIKELGQSAIGPGQQLPSGTTKSLAPGEYVGPDGKVYASKSQAESAEGQSRVEVARLSESVTNIRITSRVEALEKGMHRVADLVDSLSTAQYKEKPTQYIHDWGPEIKKLTTKIENVERAGKEIGIQVVAHRNTLDSHNVRITKLEMLGSALQEGMHTLETVTNDQIASIQEQLTDLQYDMEASIKDLQNAVDLAAGDQALIAELSAKMEGLLTEMDNVGADLNSLYSSKVKIESDVSNLMDQVSNLKMCKVDREELIDALQDKADVAQLNSIVTMEEYNADLEVTRARQTNADDKISELQKICDLTFEELQNALNERAGLEKTNATFDEHQKHLEELDKRMFAAECELKPHPAAGVVSYWSNCLSCATAAQLAGGDGEDPCFPPQLPHLPSTQPPQASGPGPLQRLFAPPQRYCGGPHTITNRPTPRFIPVPPPQALTMECDETQIPLVRQLTSEDDAFECTCDREPCDGKPAPHPNFDPKPNGD